MQLRSVPSVVWLALGSASVSSAVAWVAAGALPYDATQVANDRAMHRTPERAAESFVAAYGGGDYARASRFCTGELLARIERMAQMQSKDTTLPRSMDAELVIEQSDFIDEDHLRLSGELLAAGGHVPGQPISLLVEREHERFLVRSVDWPTELTVLTEPR